MNMCGRCGSNGSAERPWRTIEEVLAARLIQMRDGLLQEARLAAPGRDDALLLPPWPDALAAWAERSVYRPREGAPGATAAP